MCLSLKAKQTNHTANLTLVASRLGRWVLAVGRMLSLLLRFVRSVYALGRCWGPWGF